MAICYSCSFSRSSCLVVFLKIVFLRNPTYLLRKICDRGTFKTRFLEWCFLWIFEKCFETAPSCEQLLLNLHSRSKNHKVKLQKPLSFKFIFCNVFATQNLNSKAWKMGKNKNWCDTYSIYSNKFSGLGYRITFSSKESSIKN